MFPNYCILNFQFFQAMVIAFSLGMGAMPWIIMSEVPFLWFYILGFYSQSIGICSNNDTCDNLMGKTVISRDDVLPFWRWINAAQVTNIFLQIMYFMKKKFFCMVITVACSTNCGNRISSVHYWLHLKSQSKIMCSIWHITDSSNKH